MLFWTLFSEKSYSVSVALRRADSKDPQVPNVQHAPIAPWFLTELTHPKSRKSNLEGSLVKVIVLFTKVNVIPEPSTIVA